MPLLPSILRLPRARLSAAVLRTVARPFSTTPISAARQLPPRRVIPESEIEENFIKGSGPGGQKINKTSSAVQLKHLPTGIVVKCQDTRSRSINRKTARRLLQDRIEELELGEDSRTAVKAREKSRKKKEEREKALAEMKVKENKNIERRMLKITNSKPDVSVVKVKPGKDKLAAFLQHNSTTKPNDAAPEDDDDDDDPVDI